MQNGPCSIRDLAPPKVPPLALPHDARLKTARVRPGVWSRSSADALLAGPFGESVPEGPVGVAAEPLQHVPSRFLDDLRDPGRHRSVETDTQPGRPGPCP